MKKLKLSVNSQSKNIIVGDDDFVIDTKELIEELELIGDYNGIKEIKKDLDTFKGNK